MKLKFNIWLEEDIMAYRVLRYHSQCHLIKYFDFSLIRILDRKKLSSFLTKTLRSSFNVSYLLILILNENSIASLLITVTHIYTNTHTLTNDNVSFYKMLTNSNVTTNACKILIYILNDLYFL